MANLYDYPAWVHNVSQVRKEYPDFDEMPAVSMKLSWLNPKGVFRSKEYKFDEDKPLGYEQLYDTLLAIMHSYETDINLTSELYKHLEDYYNRSEKWKNYA